MSTGTRFAEIAGERWYAPDRASSKGNEACRQRKQPDLTVPALTDSTDYRLQLENGVCL